MSLRIGRAYRLRKGVDLWAFVRDTRKRGEAEVRKALRKVYAIAMAEVRIDSDGYRIALAETGSEQRARLSLARNLLREEYAGQLRSHERNLYDFNVSIAFRERDGYIYLIPHCDMMMRDVLDFLDHDPRLKEYHYQNAADRPESIGAREWRERRKVWEPMTDHEPWQDVLVLELCSWGKWPMLDPWLDLAREMKP